jgi:hypothetical protein
MEISEMEEEGEGAEKVWKMCYNLLFLSVVVISLANIMYLCLAGYVFEKGRFYIVWTKK